VALLERIHTGGSLRNNFFARPRRGPPVATIHIGIGATIHIGPPVADIAAGIPRIRTHRPDLIFSGYGHTGLI
jgi:hypothetical protein